LRGYIVDEHGLIRHHVAVFVDGQALRDKSDLTGVALSGRSEIYLLQALSGG
jgi:molybdopterin synthase sulfur carrier subunit